MSRPHPSLPLFAAVTGALLVLVAATAQPASAAARSGVDYVSLGDSYSSGVGATGVTGSCQQSPHAYGPLWAAANKPSSFRFVACGGAVTTDVVNDQSAALSAGTDLVTVTIGGNDAGFGPTAVSCVVGTDAVCKAAVATARAYIAGILPGRLDAAYAAIHHRAPSATVVVLGYPRLFETSPSCGPTGLSLAKRQAMNAAADDFSTVISARAGAAGFRYVDVRPYFAGHGICSTQEWINRVNLLDPGVSYHPTDAGYALGYLPALTAALH